MVYDYYQEKTKRSMKKKLIPALILLFLIIAIIAAVNIYMEIIQLDEIGGFSVIYVTNLLYRAASFILGFILIFAVIWITNIFIRKNLTTYFQKKELPGRKLPNFPIAAAIAFFGALITKEMFFQKILNFLNATPFNSTDPIFLKDIGFYIFTRPFYTALYGFASSLWLFVIAYTVVYYLVVFTSTYPAPFTFTTVS